jgi:hypothetical protein
MAERSTYQARIEEERQSGVLRRAEARREHVRVVTRDDDSVVLEVVETGGRTVYVELGHMQHVELMSELYAAWEGRAS